MFTTTTRERFPSSARFQSRPVCTSTSMTPLTTKSAPSATRSAAIASPMKPASPGVSIRLIFRSCHSQCAIEPEIDIRRRCSSSSQSETVEPPSIVPRRLTAPAWNSIASTSDVFPVPRCPTTATLRILPGSWAMRASSLDLSFADRRSGRESIPRSGVYARGRDRAGQARFQAQHRLGVQLGDARFGDAEHLSDLAESQVFVVVERDDELLPLGQAGDRLGDRLLHLGL